MSAGRKHRRSQSDPSHLIGSTGGSRYSPFNPTDALLAGSGQGPVDHGLDMFDFNLENYPGNDEISNVLFGESLLGGGFEGDNNSPSR